MSLPISASCAVILNLEQQQSACHERSEETADELKKSSSKNRTVVENGKVVVKPISEQNDKTIP